MPKVNETTMIYFISDIHLGGQPPEKEKEKKKALYSFFEMIKKNKGTLVILGDLFDLWYEYKHAIPKEHAKTVGKLFELREAGIEVHFILGNHDFWIDDFFSKDLGFHVYHDPSDIEFNGKKFHFHHGDGIAKNDVGYRILKKIFRFKPNIILYRWLHPDIGLPFAKYISGSSRKYTSEKEMSFDPDYEAYAKDHLDNGADFVLMGHRHQPQIEQYENGTYVNTGDWLFHRSYAQFDGDKIELQSWKNK